MSTADPNRKFDLVKDATEALSLLREASKTIASTMIWTKNQERIINTTMHLYSESDQVIYVAMPKDFDPHEFISDLTKSGTRECFFSISLMRANIFFKTTFVGYDAGLKFKSPDQVFKVQRRSDMRFSIPNAYTIKVDFDDPLFPDTRMSKKILDISASGMAILVSNEDAPVFTAGLMLNQLNFSVNKRAIQCRAEVRHVSNFKLGTTSLGHKVGLLFKEIKAADSQYIAAYVFDENRKFFQTFVQD